MSREIKFRAWDSKINQPMWTHEATLSLLMLQGRVLNDTADDKDGILERFKIMQFTGLLDKNGTEIYEGDVVRIENGDIGKITFSNDGGCAMFQMIPFKPKFLIKDYNYWNCNTEVIGNIYSNPELVK